MSSMIENTPQIKLHSDIQKFLEIYNILSADGKAQFEAQMAGSIKGQDERTKRLYHTLLLAAKNGAGVAEAIEEMKLSGDRTRGSFPAPNNLQDPF